MNENAYNSQPKGSSLSEDNDDSISFQQLIQLILSNWYWFVISVIIAIALGFAYILVKQPIYTRQASVLIRDAESNNITSAFGQFTSMGNYRTRTNLHNEMQVFKSPTYMVDVVKRLHLDMSYWIDGRFHRIDLYGKTLPIQVTLPDLNQEETASFDVLLTSDGRAKLSNFSLNYEPLESKTLVMKLGDVVQTPIGKMLISPAQGYDGSQSNQPIHVYRGGLEATTGAYAGALQVSMSDDRSSVIDLAIDDVCKDRAKDVLACLLDVYDQKWVDNINEQAANTVKFIDEELKTIEGELGNVDASISSYKSANMIPDVAAASEIFMNRAETNRSMLLDLNNQLFMAKFIKNQLQNSSGQFKPLPANSGIDNAQVSQQIILYNEKVLQRNSLISNSSTNNPLIADIDNDLMQMRQVILAAVDNTIAQLSDRIGSLKGNEASTNKQIASNPTQAKDLLSVERQQKVKEQLYLFLLQKREENQLSKAFTAYNTRVLIPPHGSGRPSSPVKFNVMLIALLLGLFIPLLLLLLINTMDNAIHNRRDLESLSLPFIGEIPLSYRKRKGLLAFLNRKRNVREIVVKEHSGNAINEAFRVVRSNLEFVLGQPGDKAKVVMFTSAYAGSGKTFISANLATCFAIKGKKVLLIDLDLRKASLSAFVNSPGRGVSDYLSGHIDNFKDITVSGTINPNLDVLPVGTNPPNPTELLFTDRFNHLLEKLSPNYDLIFIDCPPLEVVADAGIINKYCDLTIFVVRSGLFEKTMLPELERNYTENRYKNMTLLLNGTYDEFNGYGYHSYGYGYGEKKDK